MGARYDFHTHTVLSDGELLPIELIRRAKVLGFKAIAITDHIGADDPAPMLKTLKAECEMGEEAWGIRALYGVELTHVPAKFISRVADRARKTGAQVIVVHGETLVEPVEKGTNWAAVNSDIDILAHPGPLAPREAKLAAERCIFLELTSRAGHSYTNGRVVAVGRAAGASFLVNSDSHSPRDMMGSEMAAGVGDGAGLTPAELKKALFDSPRKLLEKCRR